MIATDLAIFPVSLSFSQRLNGGPNIARNSETSSRVNMLCCVAWDASMRLCFLIIPPVL